MESSETAEPQESFPDSISREQLIEALNLTDRWLRRLIRALNDGVDKEGDEFQTELRRARRQLRMNRELRAGTPPE
jgi:hypothetical protein